MAGTEQKSKTVLIAMDGSDHAKQAFHWYVTNIYRENDSVIMVNTIEPYEFLNTPVWFNAPSSMDGQIFKKLLDEEAQKIKEKLETFAELMKEAKISGTVKSIHAGSPGEGIITASKEVNADLIITGCRGLGKIRRTFLGSVSDFVLHHSDVPVIVHRH